MRLLRDPGDEILLDGSPRAADDGRVRSRIGGFLAAVAAVLMLAVLCLIVYLIVVAVAH